MFKIIDLFIKKNSNPVALTESQGQGLTGILIAIGVSAGALTAFYQVTALVQRNQKNMEIMSSAENFYELVEKYIENPKYCRLLMNRLEVPSFYGETTEFNVLGETIYDPRKCSGAPGTCVDVLAKKNESLPTDPNLRVAEMKWKPPLVTLSDGRQMLRLKIVLEKNVSDGVLLGSEQLIHEHDIVYLMDQSTVHVGEGGRLVGQVAECGAVDNESGIACKRMGGEWVADLNSTGQPGCNFSATGDGIIRQVSIASEVASIASGPGEDVKTVGQENPYIPRSLFCALSRVNITQDARCEIVQEADGWKLKAIADNSTSSAECRAACYRIY